MDGYFDEQFFSPQPIVGPIEEVEDLGLIVKNRNLTSLDQFLPFPNNLGSITCSHNNLEELPDTIPDSVTLIDCDYNKLNELPRLPHQLFSLSCSHNNLIRLPDIYDMYDFQMLDCTNNKIVELPELPSSLRQVECHHNNLTKLPELPDKLEILECQNNEITVLPNLPSGLTKLDCYDNKLISLPELPNSLKILFCRNNYFDEETLERIIAFYEKSIREKYRNTEPTIEEELEYFKKELEKIKIPKSVSTALSLDQQRVQIPRDNLPNILEYADLPTPKYNKTAGKRQLIKNKKTKKRNNNAKTRKINKKKMYKNKNKN
jgi:hypothetical protein